MAFFCTLLLSQKTLSAQNQYNNGLPNSYPQARQTVAQRQYPWRSIGSLSIAGRQFCTATLISETQVLTAAHCLWNQDTDNWYPASFMHFLASYRQGEYLGHSTAISISPSQHYRFSSPPELNSLRYDWALVTLKKPLGKTLGFIPLRHKSIDEPPIPTKGALQLAGYRQDRPEVLSVAKGCQRAVPRDAPAALEHFLIHSCKALAGDSGGPLLSGASLQEIKEGSVRVEGIHVGRQQSQQKSHSLAVPAEQISVIPRTP